MEDGENMQEDQLTTKLVQARPTSFGGANAETDAEATPLVILSTLVVICSSFSWGIAFGFSSPTESAIMEDLDMSVAQYSVFGSILTIGGVIGSLVNGKLADLVGRRGAMWISEFFFLAGWFAIAFTQVAWLLDLGRVLLGIGIGIIAFVVPTYIAEITPKNSRGAFTCSSQFMCTCGNSLAFSLGTFISWRSLALVGKVQFHAFFMLWAYSSFLSLPDGWLVAFGAHLVSALAKIGRDIQCQATLQRLRGKHTDVSQEVVSIEECFATAKGHPETGLLDLFQRRYALPLAIGVLVILSPIFVGSSGIGCFLGSIFEQADFPTNIGQVSVAVIQIPCVLLSVLLTDKCGRRPLLMVSFSGLGISCFLVGLAFCLKNLDMAEDATSILVYIGIMGYYIASSVGIVGLPWVIVSEIFPMNIKAISGSVVTLAFWISTAVATYGFNFAMAWSSAGTFFFFCGFSLVACMLVAKFVPETKGRTLEEVQESLVGALPQSASSI